MGLEAVIDEILSRGRAEADDIRRAAKEERERILREARGEGAKLMAEREREARVAADRAKVQDLARAELDSKKLVLAAQRAVLDRVYAGVLEKLATLPDRGMIVRSLLQASAADWRDGKVYASPRDADTVRAVAGPNVAGTVDCAGGVVIESADGTSKTDLRFETLLADVWRDSIGQVAEALWPTE